MRQNNFLMRTREKLVAFMSGRYGVDKLYYVFFFSGAILLLADSFVRNAIASYILLGVAVIMIVVSFARVFSKKLDRRYREAEAFNKFWGSIKAFFVLQGRRLKEMKTHRFRKCPKCKSVLRLPNKKGKHTAHCPCCGEDFKVKITL